MSAAVAVLAILLVLSLGSNAWFGIKLCDTSRELRQLRSMQELDGRQTVGMMDNPMYDATVSSGPSSVPLTTNGMYASAGGPSSVPGTIAAGAGAGAIYVGGSAPASGAGGAAAGSGGVGGSRV